MSTNKIQEFLDGTNQLLRNINFIPHYNFDSLPPAPNMQDSLKIYLYKDNNQKNMATFQLNSLGPYSFNAISQIVERWFFQIQPQLTANINKKKEMAEFEALLNDIVDGTSVFILMERPEGCWSDIENQDILFEKGDQRWILSFGCND
jgi:hypothetical protein